MQYARIPNLFDSHILDGEVRSYMSDLQCDLNNESSHSEAIVACTVKIDTTVHAARKLHRTAIESIKAILELISRRAIDTGKEGSN